MFLSIKTSKYVAVHGLVQLDKIVVVAKTIKRHLSDRYKVFAHCILFFKFKVASMNAIVVCVFFFSLRSSRNINSSKIYCTCHEVILKSWYL